AGYELGEDEDARQVGEPDGDVQRRKFHSGSSTILLGRRRDAPPCSSALGGYGSGRWKRARSPRDDAAGPRTPVPSTPDSAVLSVPPAGVVKRFHRQALPAPAVACAGRVFACGGG